MTVYYPRLSVETLCCLKSINAIDGMLSNGSVEELIEYLGFQEDLSTLFSEEGSEGCIEHTCVLHMLTSLLNCNPSSKMM